MDCLEVSFGLFLGDLSMILVVVALHDIAVAGVVQQQLPLHTVAVC